MPILWIIIVIIWCKIQEQVKKSLRFKNWSYLSLFEKTVLVISSILQISWTSALNFKSFCWSKGQVRKIFEKKYHRCWFSKNHSFSFLWKIGDFFWVCHAFWIRYLHIPESRLSLRPRQHRSWFCWLMCCQFWLIC